jgi:hypothetical protein
MKNIIALSILLIFNSINVISQIWKEPIDTLPCIDRFAKSSRLTLDQIGVEFYSATQYSDKDSILSYEFYGFDRNGYLIKKFYALSPNEPVDTIKYYYLNGIVQGPDYKREHIFNNKKQLIEIRNTKNDLKLVELESWPSTEKIANLNENKIYYAVVNDETYIKNLITAINTKNSIGLPEIPIPENQVSIAGGFFISHKNNIEWWKNTYDSKLRLYFEHDYLVKDDQVIIADCVFSNSEKFHLCEEHTNYDKWFLFQRYLL